LQEKIYLIQERRHSNMFMSEIPAILADIWMLLLPVLIVQLILLVAAVISILRKDIPQNRTLDKILWLVIVILVNIIGPILYFAIGSKKLDEIAQRDENQ